MTQKHEWEVGNNTVVKPDMTHSLLKDGVAIWKRDRIFFGMNNFELTKKREISLIFEGKEYKEVITGTNSNSARLLWSLRLKLNIRNYIKV